MEKVNGLRLGPFGRPGPLRSSTGEACRIVWRRIFAFLVCLSHPPRALARVSRRRRRCPLLTGMALRSPELRFAATSGLGALSRPSRLTPSPLAALATPRRRRRGPSPSPSPSPSDSNPSTASAGNYTFPLQRMLCCSDGGGATPCVRLPAERAGFCADDTEGPEWKKVSAKRFGFKESMIPDEAWNVLHRLRSRGASWFRSCRPLTVETLQCYYYWIRVNISIFLIHSDWFLSSPKINFWGERLFL